MRELYRFEILDYPDSDLAVHVLMGVIGPRAVWREQGVVFANGGGTMKLADMCRMATTEELRKASLRLKEYR